CSGKSSAMAISLRPISFHWESTTCDELGVGSGAVLVVRANKSKVPNDTARATAPVITFFIFSLLEVLLRLRPRKLPHSTNLWFRRITPSDGLCFGTFPGLSGLR